MALFDVSPLFSIISGFGQLLLIDLIDKQFRLSIAAVFLLFVGQIVGVVDLGQLLLVLFDGSFIFLLALLLVSNQFGPVLIFSFLALIGTPSSNKGQCPHVGHLDILKLHVVGLRGDALLQVIVLDLSFQIRISLVFFLDGPFVVLFLLLLSCFQVLGLNGELFITHEVFMLETFRMIFRFNLEHSVSVCFIVPLASQPKDFILGNLALAPILFCSELVRLGRASTTF